MHPDRHRQPPAKLLPALTCDPAGRVDMLERLAAELVAQFGPEGGRFLAALLDEAADEHKGKADAKR